jgi:tetratricopeptide (TPR) repeat protein
MKAEHRKELQTNTLADNLGRMMQGARHPPSRKILLSCGALLLAVVLIVLWRVFSHQSESDNSARTVALENLSEGQAVEKLAQDARPEGSLDWNQQREKLDLKVLQNFAEEHKGYSQEREARMEMARLALHFGLRDLGSSFAHETAVANIRKAAETFEKLVDESRDVPVLQQQALLCAGKARESLGEVEAARKWYERLAREYPDTELGKVGKADAERVQTSAAEIEEITKALNARAIPKPPGGGS